MIYHNLLVGKHIADKWTPVFYRVYYYAHGHDLAFKQ